MAEAALKMASALNSESCFGRRLLMVTTVVIHFFRLLFDFSSLEVSFE